ncbi:MAG: SoxR reducing system RseC family protein [Desulfobacteraceae bacterium]|nr:SoxR reducing system RseC family protein [Desulfobacteraceae bacterium]
MAREVGVVTKIKEDSAVVKTQRATACEGCSEKSTCHSMGGSREMEIIALNPVQAKLGDRVTLEYATGRMLQLSLLLYIFPIVALLAGAIIGDSAAPALGADPSILAAVLGFTALFLSLGILLALEKKARKSDKYKPTIISAKRAPQAHAEKCELCG